MTDVRWEGMTHAEIYRRVHAGPGRGASTAVESAWVDTESVIRGIEGNLAVAINQAGGDWEGPAAEAARAGLTPLGRWVADAAGDANLTAGGVQAQGEQAAWLRSAMPSPTAPLWNEPPGRAGVDPLYILEDVQALEQRSADEAAQAVHLMHTYTSNSYANIQAMDYWIGRPSSRRSPDRRGRGAPVPARRSPRRASAGGPHPGPRPRPGRTHRWWGGAPARSTTGTAAPTTSSTTATPSPTTAGSPRR